MADSIRKFSDIQNIEEISDPRDLFNIIRKAVAAYTKNSQRPLIKLLYKKGATQREVAEAKKINHATLAEQFPLKETLINGR